MKIDYGITAASDESGAGKQGKAMTGLLNFTMLVCATIGSMAFGILAAYWMLRAGFALMRPQRQRAVMKTQPEVARLS